MTKRNYAENLAAGTGSGYGIQQAVQSWTNEACLSMMSLRAISSFIDFLEQLSTIPVIHSHLTTPKLYGRQLLSSGAPLRLATVFSLLVME